MSLSAFDTWFFAARDEENKIDGVGAPVGTTLLYKFCHNDTKAFEGACALLERAFNAGGAYVVPPNWLPTSDNVNALPAPVRRYIHDMVSNADPAGTVREVTQLRDQVRELAASNRMLRDRAAELEAQGVPDVFEQEVRLQKLNDLIDEFGAEKATEAYHGGFHCRRSPEVVRAEISDMLASAPPAPQALTTCNCRWDGETQVQQCTLHEAHVDAIHEWAERAKTAEAKLLAPQASVAQQEPLGFISPKQVERIVDPSGEFGAYIPMRKTPAGNFTLAVYPHPAPQAKPQPLSEDVLLAAWNESAVCRGSLGSRRQAFVEGARFVESRLGVEGAQ